MLALAIGVPATLAVVLGFIAWRDWLRFNAPSAPSEALLRRVKELEDRLGTVERYAQIETGPRGSFGG